MGGMEEKEKGKKSQKEELENDQWKAHLSDKVIVCNNFLQYGNQVHDYTSRMFECFLPEILLSLSTMYM